MFTGESHNYQLLEEGHTHYAHPAEPVFETTVASCRERKRLTFQVLVFGKRFIEIQTGSMSRRQVLLTLVQHVLRLVFRRSIF